MEIVQEDCVALDSGIERGVVLSDKSGLPCSLVSVVVAREFIT